MTGRGNCIPAIIAALILVGTAPASVVEHPGILHKDDNCSTCHADKFRGKSVHSAMEIPCTVCHMAQTRGDMTTLDLLMPKERICFACHVKSSDTEDHSPHVKGVCVGCHAAHSSNRRMLLLEQADKRHGSSVLVPTRAANASRRPSQRMSRHGIRKK